ncbi:Aminopeptidase 2, mitochondrial [Beauveria bassiana]|uniref:Aminopeptidase n=1 Tax=Beauveria bassiana TaxID=176275 RepID=A0A2N6NWF6_BEABA|nr:Aminopeptidase 2, mitochondrial [Beauveria bassiana]
MSDREILPDNVKPHHYGLSIKDIEFKNWTYKGTVTIDSELVKPTTQIVVNTLELKLLRAKVSVDQTKSTQSWQSTNFSNDEKAQRTTITFDQEIPVSSKATVTIEFQGTINNNMAGFYRSRYKPVAGTTPAASVPFDDEWHYMFSTQFESCDARRAFPCFDEPNLKASFDLEIEVPVDQVALSNMPVKETKPSRDGWHVVSFERTPRMSSYLLAWAVGDFEYVEAFTDRRYNGKQLPVRVYTTRGLKEQGRWALEHAPQTIDFFSEIFDIDYPLPKSDLLAVHEFTHGAMENWGLVTYRTTRVLYDEKTSSPRLKNDIAYVVAHELAHQWFGNLVTMDWWDELWLNEGFATWVGWYAVDHIHPDWEVWAQFVNEGMETAFKLDGLRASHPIHVPVRDALDVNQIFDSISYLKGCSSIRMLANHLGVKTFLKGVSSYLKANAYKNAKTSDLWAHLSEASGKKVDQLMGPWIGKIGHPVITVSEQPGQLSVKQTRFLSSGDVKPDDDTTTWWVPLGLEGKKGEAGISSVELNAKEETINGIDDGFYKLNSGATGFFRVNYPESRLIKLSSQLDRLDPVDKMAIIGSTAELAFAGNCSTASLLTFLSAFANETHPLVWSQVLDAISGIKSVFNQDEAIRTGLNKFTIKLIENRIKSLGFHPAEDESYLTIQLRTHILTSAVSSRHPETLAEALKRFNAWAEKPEASTLHPSLLPPVLQAAIVAETARAVDFLKKEWFETKSVDGKLVISRALGYVPDGEIIKNEIIPFNFNSSPRDNNTADMHFLGAGLANNPFGRQIQWQYMKDNWATCLKKLSNPIVLDRFIRSTLSNFVDDADVADITAFFQDKDVSSYNRTLKTAKDKSSARAAYKKRDAAAIKEWLAAKGY